MVAVVSVMCRERMIVVARKKKDRTTRSNRMNSPYRFRNGKIVKVVSERVVFGDIAEDAEIDMTVDVEQRGISRGGRSHG